MMIRRPGYNPVPCRSRQIVFAKPRYSAKGHHIPVITARLRLLSVTESVALPPYQKAVDVSDFPRLSLREWLVPPVLLPIFFVVLIAASMLVQW
jgi:hypothetical protein